jgi:hypothetical protein
VSVPNPVASRRTAIAAGLAGLLAVTGCDADPGSDGPASPQTSAPPVDADSDLVDEVLQHIAETAAVVTEVRRRDRRAVRPLVELHAAHSRALPAGSSEVLTLPRPRSLDQVRDAETKLQRQLTDAAVRAESGALAKLFASMAAAVAQHLAALS